MNIRRATQEDSNPIRRLCVSAFGEEESEDVATLAVQLLGETSVPETFALVAEVDGSVVGHVCFSPVFLERSDESLGYLLSPLAVRPEFQGRGIGTRLVETGIEQLKEGGADIVFVYGNPNYYGRFGFEADRAAAYAPPCPIQYPWGWQARHLTDDTPATGKLRCVPPLSDPRLW